MSNSNDFNSAAAGSSSSNDKTYPDNARRMSDVSTLSSEAQSSGMTTSAVSSGSFEPRIAAPSIHSSIEELDSTIIGATQVILNLSVRLLSTTPESEEDSMVRAKYLLQRAMTHAVPTAWTGAPQVAPAALNVVPPNLPLMQWKGAVFDPSAPVSVDVKHCLKKFQDVMFAHGLDLDQHWLRLLPPCLSSSQRTWLDEYQEKEDVHTWSQFKKAFTGHYGVGSAEEKATSTTELLRISMTAAETVDQYVERFNNLRRLAQIQDRCVLTRCFLIGLQADIYKKVIVSLANLRRVANASHTSAGPSMVNDSSSSGRKKSSAFVSGSAVRAAPYPKASRKYCSFHKTTTHSNDECRAMKKSSSLSPSSGSTQVDVSSGSAASQWNPRNQPSGKGRSTGSSADDSDLAGPSHLFRGMSRSPASSLSSVASSGNDVSASVGSSATPTTSSSDASSGRKTDAAGPVASVPDSSDDMDIDVAEALTVAEAAQAFPTPNPGSIKLGHNSSSIVSRLGIINLTVYYNQIRLPYEFEVFDFSSDVPICLGLDILPKLRIGLTGLATSWLNSNIPKIPDPVNPDDYKPNETPVGTKQERQQLMSTIQPLLDANTSIPMSSHCNLPGAIITLDTEPNAFAYRRQPDIAIANRKIMEDQIQTWLDDCVIEPAPSNTRFNNPIFLVGKKDVNGLYTKKRAVIDPRMLNQLVKNVDRMPLPLISDLHQRMGSATIFTTFDIRACFHRFLIQESDRPKTAFTHPFTGMQYQFRHCPFGLTSTGNIVQRVLTNLFADLPYTALYIDDLCVFSSGDMNQHIEYVREALKRLTAANLIINVEKTHFAQSCVNILGWTIANNGSLIPDQRKLTNIHSWPTPKTGRQVMSFLGFANYFRNSLPMFSRLTAPLDRLRSLNSLKGIWNETHECSFRNIKDALVNAPVIHIPNLKYPFYVATDASAYGIGGVVYQVIDQVIQYNAFAARSLSPTERRYHTNKRELLAIVFMFERYNKWLYNRHFTLTTDHKALIYIKKQVVPNAAMLVWFETIFEYSFDIVHCPGIKNIIPDALSRLFPDDNKLEGGNNVNNVAIYSIRGKEKEKRKPTFKEKSKSYETQTYAVTSATSSSSSKPLLHRALQYEDYITPPPEERKDIILKAHLLGHYGIKAIEQTIHGDKLHWTNLRQDIQDVISKCHECKMFNIAKTGYHPPRSILPDGPLDHWVMDLGTFNITSTSGNNFLLVMVDLFSRFTILKAIPDKQALTIAKQLVDIFCTFGWPKVIASDNGKEFTATIVTELINNSGIDKRVSNPFNPLGNSVNEAFVGIAKKTIVKQLQGRKEDWDLYVPATQYAMNLKYSRLHKSRPYTVIFNKVPNDMKDYSHIKPTLRSEAVDSKAIENRLKYATEVVIPALAKRIKETQDVDNAYFMKTNKIVHTPFPLHSEVMIKNVNKENKTDPYYEGPFYISGMTTNGSYILVDKQNNLLSRDVPTSHLKLIALPSNKSAESIDDQHYEIQAIIQHKGTPGNYQYLVHWKGYDDPMDYTWEPTSSFDDRSSIETYWARRQAGNNTAVSKKARLPKRTVPTRDHHSRSKRSRR
ncbi:hypothetical protein RO3G_13450 [Rhizopus delemar RA 99-880]|uniref:Reverse transcriptase n=1 Tax=Rhizopus delemar (strain RA 99-880 / ATCC MYA-4621 / FGSC 9543 / NRRL 43880) TaxID=246409 RepID=I1CJV9_RHIO9|nr:hypothetical protein RO3G_13450 [Rhizopus delemar RA 99-880]|eukprot:EIE88739.1 hypothetical protein RO3G_13450 [Rhizopus delemar RA 99-880]